MGNSNLNLVFTKNIYNNNLDISSQLDCCGVNGPNDYTAAKLTIPQSCYSAGNSTSSATNNTLNKDGCLTKLTESYENALKFVRIFSFVLIGVEVSAHLSKYLFFWYYSLN